MAKLTDCTDCLWCKVNFAKGYVKCACKENGSVSSYWLSVTGKEKVIRLGIKEVKKKDIIWRDMFTIAKDCLSAKSMI